MTTLEAQRRRLLDELRIAEMELQQLNEMPVVEPAMVNFYQDLLVRHREMIRTLESHLPLSTQLEQGVAVKVTPLNSIRVPKFQVGKRYTANTVSR